MCITHGHRKRRMPKDFLQREDISTIHHEMAGEGVPESVTGLSLRQLNRGVL